MKYVACCLAWLCLTTSASAIVITYGTTREVKPPALQEEELLKFRLDADIFSKVRDGLPDIQLSEEGHGPVPYVVRRARATTARTVRKTWSPLHLDARPLDNGGLEITVRLKDDDLLPQSVRLVTPLRDFEHRVRVYSSAGGNGWAPLTDEQLIFDYSRFVDVRNDDFALPKTDHKHLRFIVDDVTAAQESELLTLTRRLRGADETEQTEKVTVDRRPFRIDRLEFSASEQKQSAAGDEKITYPIAGFRVETDAEMKQTVVTVDAGRTPLTSLRIETPDRNFSRRAVVEIPQSQGTQTTWRQIGEATLTRVDFKTVQRETLSLSFAESRHEKYRIVIDDRDGPPLQIAGVMAEGNAYDLFFLADPNNRYRLYYGSVDAGPEKFDTAPIEEVLNKGFPALPAELGEARRVDDGPITVPWRWTDLLNNKPLLFGAIALLVVVLGFGLFRAAKRVNELPRS